MPHAEPRLQGVRAATGRRLAAVGAWVVLATLLIVFLVVPEVQRWKSRELAIDAAQEKLAQLERALQNAPVLDSLIDQREAVLASQPQRVLRARSRPLAASALQSLVQEMAEASNVTVTRLDVANIENAGNLPITLAANGDIFGLAELLRQIRTARFAMVVEKLQTQNNSALRGAPDVLQIALTLQAPVIVQ